MKLFIISIIMMMPVQAAEVITMEDVMKIRSAMDAQRQLIAAEKAKSTFWYNKYIELQKCITDNAAAGFPTMTCINNNTGS